MVIHVSLWCKSNLFYGLAFSCSSVECQVFSSCHHRLKSSILWNFLKQCLQVTKNINGAFIYVLCISTISLLSVILSLLLLSLFCKNISSYLSTYAHYSVNNNPLLLAIHKPLTNLVSMFFHLPTPKVGPERGLRGQKFTFDLSV